MSYSYYNYIGAYIETKPIQIKKSEPICMCEKCNIKKNLSDENKFCTECGTQIIKSINTYNSLSPLIIEIEKKLPQYEECLAEIVEGNLISNQDDEGVVYNGEDSDITKEITSEIIENSILKFKNQNKKMIEDIEKTFNLELKIKFGFISYVM